MKNLIVIICVFFLWQYYYVVIQIIIILFTNLWCPYKLFYDICLIVYILLRIFFFRSMTREVCLELFLSSLSWLSLIIISVYSFSQIWFPFTYICFLFSLLLGFKRVCNESWLILLFGFKTVCNESWSNG